MTQKTIGNLLKRLRKKRNEAVLAVGKIDREIDEAIARAKIPQLEIGDLFVSNTKSVNDSNPPRWVAAIITGKSEHDLQSLKIRQSTNLGIHCSAKTKIINISPPDCKYYEYEFPQSPLDLKWKFNSKNWHYKPSNIEKSIKDKNLSIKDRWQIDGLQNNLIHDKSFKYNSESNYLNQDLSSILTTHEKIKFLDEGLVKLRLHIAKRYKDKCNSFFEEIQESDPDWYKSNIIGKESIWVNDTNGKAIIPLCWYSYEGAIEENETDVILLNDGWYKTENSKLTPWLNFGVLGTPETTRSLNLKNEG
jgi:hypothetical protein